MESYESSKTAKKPRISNSPEKEFKSIASEDSHSFLPNIKKPCNNDSSNLDRPRLILPSIETTQFKLPRSRSISPSINELRKASTSPDIFRTISPSIEKQRYLSPDIEERRSNWKKFMNKKNKVGGKHKK